MTMYTIYRTNFSIQAMFLKVIYKVFDDAVLREKVELLEYKPKGELCFGRDGGLFAFGCGKYCLIRNDYLAVVCDLKEVEATQKRGFSSAR